MHAFVGDPYSRGVQHGEQLGEAIRGRLVRSFPGDTNPASRHQLAEPWLAMTAATAPGLVEELAGMAEGSRTHIDDILLLNCFEAFDLADMVEAGGCTAIAYAGPGFSLAAQNWDANPELAAGLSVHVHRDPELPDVAVLASPGGLGWIGMNEHGLALVNNDLLGGPTTLTAPSQVVRRLLLQESNTADAVARARTLRHPALRSYLLADSHGELASLEVLAEGEPAVVTSSTKLTHSNHAKTVAGRASEDMDTQRSVYPSSAQREQRALSLLGHLPDPGEGLLTVRRILADHDGCPLSICRHPSMDESTVTAASVIFDCTQRQATFALGLACRPGSLEEVRL